MLMSLPGRLCIDAMVIANSEICQASPFSFTEESIVEEHPTATPSMTSLAAGRFCSLQIWEFQ
jgi:hypothetical protein